MQSGLQLQVTSGSAFDCYINLGEQWCEQAQNASAGKNVKIISLVSLLYHEKNVPREENYPALTHSDY